MRAISKLYTSIHNNDKNIDYSGKLERLTCMKTLSNGSVVWYIKLFGILNFLRSSWPFPYAFRFPSLKIWRFLVYAQPLYNLDPNRNSCIVIYI